MVKKNMIVPFEKMLKDTLAEYGSDGELKKAANSTSMAMRMAAAFVHGAREFDIDPTYSEMGELDGEIFRMADGESLMTETDDYIKAWFLMELLAKEFDIAGADKITMHVNVTDAKAQHQPRMMKELASAMANASKNETWKKCRCVALDHLDWFENVDPMYIYSLTHFNGSVRRLSTPA
ncbi:MAG: hypothetical protein Q4C40_05400 [Eubacteriales bacterium]|nr:hypothetical protein [Eubacteriales bacterium]